MEQHWRGRLVGQFSQTPTLAAEAEAAQRQVVFCIDVRSEPFRRHLEAADASIDTEGFAGFFAMPIAVDDGEREQGQCPVLLQPSHAVQCSGGHQHGGSAEVLGSFRRSAMGGFAFMETGAVAEPGRCCAGPSVLISTNTATTKKRP